jgi:hypothetical protein
MGVGPQAVDARGSMNGLTPEEREAEALAAIERQFAGKKRHEVEFVAAPGSMLVGVPVPQSDERALPLGVDLAGQPGVDVSEKL